MEQNQALDDPLKIPLTQGEFALVDADDYEELSKYKWYCEVHSKKNGYKSARRTQTYNGKDIKISMHRLIMNCSTGWEVDHINGNPLDNRKSNLRIVSRSENMRNRKGLQKNNTSGLRGVDFQNGKWRAKITINNKTIFLGNWDTKIEAHFAYLNGAKKYHGKFNDLIFNTNKYL